MAINKDSFRMTKSPGNYKPLVETTGPTIVEQQLAQSERSNELMAESLSQQASFNAESIALQERQFTFAQASAARQEQLALLANVEPESAPGQDVNSKIGAMSKRQLLRRGMMSTFTRYKSKPLGG